MWKQHRAVIPMVVGMWKQQRAVIPMGRPNSKKVLLKATSRQIQEAMGKVKSFWMGWCRLAGLVVGMWKQQRAVIRMGRPNSKKVLLKETRRQIQEAMEKVKSFPNKAMKLESQVEAAQKELEAMEVEAAAQVEQSSGVSDELANALEKAQEAVMMRLQEQSAAIQQHYSTQIKKFQQELNEIKVAEDLAWSKDAEALAHGRDAGYSLEGSEARRQRVSALVKKIHEEWKEKAADAQAQADRADAEAAELVHKGTELLEKARQAKVKMEALAEKERMRENERSQSNEQARAATATLQEKAKSMIASNAENLDALQNLAMSGAYIWGWYEDSGRWGAHPEDLRKGGSASNPMVLLKQRNWSMLEAHYALFIVNGSYSKVLVDVGGKIFHQHTGTRYTMDLQTMVQINEQTKFQRKIQRLPQESLSDAQLGELEKQRAEAVAEATVLAEHARKAWEEASLKSLQAARCAARAEERAKGLNASQWKVATPNNEAIGMQSIPMGWDDMGDCVYTEKPLTSGTEYEQIKAYFEKSNPGVKVTSVDRIQNVLLWKMYTAAKEQVKAKKLNNGVANEEFLWHGTPAEISDKISSSGFDVSFGKSTPKGTWLSTNSRYSVDYAQGAKSMFLTRCLLGYCGQISDNGTPHQKNGEPVDSHHCGQTSKGHVRADDQAGGGTDNRYVIPHSNNVYPAYRVNFE